MPSITVPRKLVLAVIVIVLGMAGTGVTALVAEVIGASRSRAVQAVKMEKAREVQAIQMESLIDSIDKIGIKLDTSVKAGSRDRDVLRARISILEQHASRTDGDISGILRAIAETKDRLAAIERADRRAHPEGG